MLPLTFLRSSPELGFNAKVHTFDLLHIYCSLQSKIQIEPSQNIQKQNFQNHKHISETVKTAQNNIPYSN